MCMQVFCYNMEIEIISILSKSHIQFNSFHIEIYTCVFVNVRTDLYLITEIGKAT